MKISKLMLFLVPLLLVASSAHATSPRVETHEYIAAGGDILIHCGPTTGLNVGGACSTLDGSETSVTITIADAAFAPVGGYYQFVNTALDIIVGSSAFCGSTVQSVPTTADRLYVYVDQAYSTLDCASPGAGTTGTITLAYE